MPTPDELKNRALEALVAAIEKAAQSEETLGMVPALTEQFMQLSRG